MTTGARRIPDQTQDEESVRPSLLRRAIGGGLVLALTAVGAGIVYSQMDESEDKPSTFETIAPPVVDPVQKTDVSPPTNLEGQANGDGTVTFSWQPPNSEWHGRYLYRQVIAGKETTLESTKETSVTIQSDVGRTCLEVFSLREDGRSSTAVTTCVEG